LRKLLVFILFFALKSQVSWAQGEIKYSRAERNIQFGLIYPFIKLNEGLKKREGINGGVDIQYDYFPVRHFAFSLRSYYWVKPLKAAGKSKKSLYSLAGQLGGVYRVLPSSFFDPRLMILGGVAQTAAGSKVPAKVSYPVSTRLGFNLWRQTEKFNDPALAFYTSGGINYYFNSPKQIDKKVYDVGVYFKGSF